MSDETAAEIGRVESPPAPAQGKPEPLPTTKKRLRKKVLTPLVLGILGLALLLGAFFLYPRITELPTPAYTELDLTTTASINTIFYVVHTSLVPVKIDVGVLLSPGQRAAPTTLTIWLPIGLRFADCHTPCGVLRSSNGLFQSYWIKKLTFKSGVYSTVGATVSFRIQASNFGAVFNDVDASVAIPEIVYKGPDNTEPQFDIAYNIPSASTYDWSSLPTQLATSYVAEWIEDIPDGITPARVAVGINHGAQSNDNTRTFVAGALLGLAGGAILSAIQEALHATD